MRDPVTCATENMATPSPDLRAEAVQAGTSPDALEVHAGFLRDWPCLSQIECRQPDATPAPPESVTIAAWNIERCKRVEESATLLRAAGVDIVLATEMDWGMARSGQRHTPRDLAAELGMGYVYGVEFVELGTGDPYETSLFAGVPNEHGLHGNAILSRLPLKNVALIPLDEGGRWYAETPKNDGQLRIGGRMAMSAQVELAGGPLSLAAVHYESESDAAGRDVQTGHLIAGLDALYGAGSCVIGGDLNTKELAGLTPAEVLRGAPSEPSFARFAAAGFDWRLVNTGAPTNRAAPGKQAYYPLRRLDWLFARGIDGHSPRDWAAISERGEYLSDHELITARFSHPAGDAT